MAIAVNTSRHHTPTRPPWVRRRSTDDAAPLAAFMIVLVLIGLAVIALSAQMFGAKVSRPLFGHTYVAPPARPAEGAAPRSNAAPAATAVQPALAPAAPEAEQAASAAAPPTEPAAPPAGGLEAGARARVANTDGMGVVFHAAPRSEARQPAGLLEGTAVTVLERSGEEWTKVQSDTKQSGWVRTVYLIPTE